MGTYTRTYSLTDGTTAYGSQVAYELDALGNSVNNIVNAQISSGANISDSKLAQLTTASKVALSALVQGSTATEILKAGAGTAAWDEYSDIFLTPKEYTTDSDTTTSNESTTNSAYQDSALSITFTVGKDGMVYASFAGAGVSDSGTGKWALVVDGVVKKEICHIAGSGDQLFPLSIHWHGVLTAGSHTIKIQKKNDGGGGATHIKGATCTAYLDVSYPT